MGCSGSMKEDELLLLLGRAGAIRRRGLSGIKVSRTVVVVAGCPFYPG